MTIDNDDWDAHWSNYGDTSGALNPANRMRERLILSLLGENEQTKAPARPAVVAGR